MSKKALQSCMKAVEDLKVSWPDFDISIEELSTPTPKSVLKFYNQCLLQLHMDLNVVVEKASIECDNVNSYSDTLYQLIMYFCVKDLFIYIGMLDSFVKSFSLRDIFDPAFQDIQPKVIIVCNISQYVSQFYAEQSGPMAIRDKIEKYISDADEFHKELNTAKKQLHALSLKKANDDMPELLKIVAENKQVLHTNEQHRLQNEELLKEKDNIHELNACKMKEKDMMRLLEQKLQEYSKLKSQVVENPETILSEIQCLENKIAEASLIVNENIQILADENQSGLKYAKMIETCQKLTDIDIIKKYDRNPSVRTRIECTAQAIKKLREESGPQLNELAANQELLENLESKLQSNRLKHATKKSAYLQEIQRLDDELLSGDEEIKKDTNKQYELGKKIVALEIKLAEYENNMKFTTEHFKQQYNKILHEYGLHELFVERNLKSILSYKY